MSVLLFFLLKIFLVFKELGLEEKTARMFKAKGCYLAFYEIKLRQIMIFQDWPHG